MTHRHLPHGQAVTSRWPSTARGRGRVGVWAGEGLQRAAQVSVLAKVQLAEFLQFICKV